jgi:hypothetical protein
LFPYNVTAWHLPSLFVFALVNAGLFALYTATIVTTAKVLL